MRSVPVRASRVLWLSIVVLTSVVPFAAQPSTAQSGVSCATECIFLPAVVSHGAVFVEHVTLQCDGTEPPIPCYDVSGYIRNESANPVYDVQLDAHVRLPDGRQETLVAPTIPLRGLAPGQSTPFNFSSTSGGGVSWPVDTVAVIAVRSYATSPGSYRPITVVDTRVVFSPPEQPGLHVFRVVLRNDTPERVSDIRLVLDLQSKPEWPGWRTEPIPPLAPGERYVYDYLLYRIFPVASGVFGAEGVVVP